MALPSGRSLSPVFNRFMQLPPVSAVIPERGEFFMSPAFSITQGLINENASNEHPVIIFMDFESYSLELPIQFGLGNDNAIGVNLHCAVYSGGFLDPVVSSFHHLFGFENNNRDLIPESQMEIAIMTGNGFSFDAKGTVVSFSDPVFWYTRGLITMQEFHLSGSVLGTVPLGFSGGLGGLSLPQAAVSLSGLYEISGNAQLYANAGFILPIEALDTGSRHPLPTFQSRGGVAFSLAGDLWCALDLSFRTSSITTEIISSDGLDYFAQPSLDLLVSIVWKAPRGNGTFASVSVQEDPVLHNSSDVGFIGTGAFRFK